MRTLTGAWTGLYTNPYASQSDRFVVEIYHSSTWTDISDWLIDLSYGGSQDAPYEIASINLFLVHDSSPSYNLSPYATNSAVSGYITLNKKIRIRAASSTAGTDPTDADLAVVFLGRIYSFEFDQEHMTLECQDESAILQERWAEKVITYSQAGTAQVEAVMQSILDDHYNTKAYRVGGTTPNAEGNGITLYSAAGTAATPFAGGDSPGWVQNPYEQQRQPILDALHLLADQIGYLLRWRYHEGAGLATFVLVFEAPDRAPASALTIPYSRVISYGPIKQSKASIRNVVAIDYEASTGERILSQDGTTFANGEDTASVDSVGRLWLEIREDSTSQIDTAAEARIMSDNIINDLRHGLESFNIVIPYLLPVWYGDLITVTADNIISDANQAFCVIGIKHEASTNGAQTTLTLRGAYETKRKLAWIGRQADQPIRKDIPDNAIFETVTSSNMVPNSDFGAYGRA